MVLTYVRVRSGVAIRAKLQESRLKERLFICLRAIAPFPTKRARLGPTENSFGGDLTLRRFAGTPTEGLFRAFHRNIALSESVFEQALSLHFIRILPSAN